MTNAKYPEPIYPKDFKACTGKRCTIKDIQWLIQLVQRKESRHTFVEMGDICVVKNGNIIEVYQSIAQKIFLRL